MRSLRLHGRIRSKREVPMSASPPGVTQSITSARKAWCAPQLVRVGTVAAITSKKDNIGRNDGGTGTMKRT